MFERFFASETIWFGVPALAGTALFLIRMLLSLLGGDGDAHDGGMDGGAHHGHGTDDSGHAFTVLSVHSVAAFAMGFGWGGLGATLGAGWSPTAAMLTAAGAGVAMVWLLAWLLRAVWSLQSSGTVDPKSAIGTTGEVYVTVPEYQSGSGRVRLVIRNRERIYDAVTEGEALPPHARVRVLAVNEDSTLTVAPA
jgi:hypothetical protein